MEGSVLLERGIAPEKLVDAIEERLRERTKFKGFYGAQREALLRVLEMLVSKGRVRGVVQMPTGSGKTVLAAAVIAGVRAYYNELGYEWGILGLFLTPRVVIRRQAYETFRRAILGAIEGAGVREVKGSADFCDGLSGWSHTKRVTSVEVVTPQLLVRVFKEHKRCWELLRKSADVVIVDEAHTYYVGKEASQAVRELVKSDIPVVLGLTATPLRDTINLVGDLIYHKHSRELMDGQVLAKDLVIRVYTTDIKIPRLRHLPARLRKKEWELSWLYAIRERAGKYAEVVYEVLRNLKEDYLGSARYPKALVVAPNINEADMLYEELRNKLRTEVDQDPTGARKKHVFIAHYGVPDAHEQVEAFKRANEGVLVAVNMVDIGFDDPNLEVMFLARPIRNPIAYVQLRGRVLRKPQPARGSGDVNLKSIRGAFIVDLVGREDKMMLEGCVPMVEEGHYGREMYDSAIKELVGLKMVREMEASVSVKYAYEYRVSESRFTHREPEEHVKIRVCKDSMKLLLVSCLEDLLEKGVCKITCPGMPLAKVPPTKVRLKLVSYPTYSLGYFLGRLGKRVVIEIANREKGEMEMSSLLKEDGSIDFRKLVAWFFRTLAAQGLSDCVRFMLRQRVLSLKEDGSNC